MNFHLTPIWKKKYQTNTTVVCIFLNDVFKIFWLPTVQFIFFIQKCREEKEIVKIIEFHEHGILKWSRSENSHNFYSFISIYNQITLCSLFKQLNWWLFGLSFFVEYGHLISKIPLLLIKPSGNTARKGYY